MIKDNCLVGCSDINHHKACDNFVIINFECEDSIYRIENSIFLNSELEKIILKHNIRVSKITFKKESRWKRFYFMYYCLEVLNMFDYQVFNMIGTTRDRFKYALETHHELITDKSYIAKTLEIAEDLKSIKRI